MRNNSRNNRYADHNDRYSDMDGGYGSMDYGYNDRYSSGAGRQFRSNDYEGAFNRNLPHNNRSREVYREQDQYGGMNEYYDRQRDQQLYDRGNQQRRYNDYNDGYNYNTGSSYGRHDHDRGSYGQERNSGNRYTSNYGRNERQHQRGQYSDNYNGDRWQQQQNWPEDRRSDYNNGRRQYNRYNEGAGGRDRNDNEYDDRNEESFEGSAGSGYLQSNRHRQ